MTSDHPEPNDEIVRGDGLHPPSQFARIDEDDDSLFYEYPRKLVHIEASTIQAVSELYAELLPSNGGHILDLMSSWRSHLPRSYRPQRVVGLGMNAEEMAENPQLTEHLVKDLNLDPRLPFPDNQFDAAVCTVSVQYLVHPLLVFQEVHRVLRSGGPFIVSFSNRCFPTKAVALWYSSGDKEHRAIVRSYFQASASWTGLRSADRSPKSAGDPLYEVWALKA